MDKEKRNDAFKNKVNQVAEQLYDYKINDNKSEFKNARGTLFSLLYFYAQKNYKIEERFRDAYLDCAIKVFCECIEKWAPGNQGFYQYYMHILNLRSKDIYKNEEIPFAVNEDDSIKEIDDCDVNVEAEVTDDLLFKYRFNIFTEVTATLKKANENNNLMFTTSWFYSEFITSGIHEKKHINLIKKKEHRIMKIVDHEFISYYMDGKNDSVDSISKGTLKSLSCFTGNMNDNKPCGYPLSSRYVYLSYLSKLNREEYTLATINYFKNKLREMLHEAEMKQD